MPLLGLRQPMQMTASPGAMLSCEAADGSPLAARVRCGEGTVFIAGFMPGIGYIHTAMLARNAAAPAAADPADWTQFAAGGDWSQMERSALSYNPWEYPVAEREFLLQPVEAAGVVPPVALSEPLIEAFLLESERGAVVTLANYSLRPVEALRVTIRPGRLPTSIESVRLGELGHRVEGDEVTVELPLTDTDMLLLRR
jgi:hypothetical protein